MARVRSALNGIVAKSVRAIGKTVICTKPEGRVVKNASGNFEYQYAITDHQGNTRVCCLPAQRKPHKV
jgi:hypothetical protein